VRQFPNITRHLRRWLFIGFCTCVSGSAALAAPPDQPVTTAKSHQDYLHLKDRFETLVQNYSDPAILACLAVETTAQAWILAAAGLAEDPSAQDLWRTKAMEFEKSWSASRDWEGRHWLALKIYHEALREVVRQLAKGHPEGSPVAELAAELNRNDSDLAVLAANPPDASLEKEILSRSLIDLARLIIRSIGPRLNPRADLILAEVAEKTQALRDRKDLHYRAKLAFIYAAQIQGLTDLIFLLGPTAGPPLNHSLAEIKAALEKTGTDHRLSTTLCLVWTAQAQASLPLAYWLSTRPGTEQGRHP